MTLAPMTVATVVPRVSLLAALFISVPSPAAQPVGTCDLGTARTDLTVNDVRARLYNKGNLFFDGGSPLYEVPTGSGISPIFAASIWVGGLVEGEIRTAAGTYAQAGEDYEFYPGPLGPDGSPPADCEPFDRIWRVSRFDLADYERTGVASADLAEWPAALGAPYFDVDGDGRYDLAAGDRPAISGDEMAWWVMNDVAGPHRTTLSEPVGLEARVSAFAKAVPDSPLTHTTFYRYELTYRGTGANPVPLDSAYFTFWSDPDLGNFTDDYIGSDTTRNLGFVYNADNDDDEGAGGYGPAPPAQGVRWLDTPDDLGMTVFS